LNTDYWTGNRRRFRRVVLTAAQGLRGELAKTFIFDVWLDVGRLGLYDEPSLEVIERIIKFHLRVAHDPVLAGQSAIPEQGVAYRSPGFKPPSDCHDAYSLPAELEEILSDTDALRETTCPLDYSHCTPDYYSGKGREANYHQHIRCRFWRPDSGAFWQARGGVLWQPREYPHPTEAIRKPAPSCEEKKVTGHHPLVALGGCTFYHEHGIRLLPFPRRANPDFEWLLNDYYLDEARPHDVPLRLGRSPRGWEWTPRGYERRIARACGNDPDLISQVWEKIWLWNWPPTSDRWEKIWRDDRFFAIPQVKTMRQWCDEYEKHQKNTPYANPHPCPKCKKLFCSSCVLRGAHHLLAEACWKCQRAEYYPKGWDPLRRLYDPTPGILCANCRWRLNHRKRMSLVSLSGPSGKEGVSNDNSDSIRALLLKQTVGLGHKERRAFYHSENTEQGFNLAAIAVAGKRGLPGPIEYRDPFQRHAPATPEKGLAWVFPGYGQENIFSIFQTGNYDANSRFEYDPKRDAISCAGSAKSLADPGVLIEDGYHLYSET